MAKIITGKTPGSEPEVKKSFDTSPVGQIPVQKFAEPIPTAPVQAVPVQVAPTPSAPAKEKPQVDIPKVKVARPGERFVPPSPAPILAPKAAPVQRQLSPEVPNSRNSSRLLFAFVAGFILIVMAVSRMKGAPASYDGDFLPQDAVSREMLLRDDPNKMAQAMWKNETPGFFSKFFSKLCLGYAKSDGCSSEPLHPFKSVAEQHGIELKFPEETDKRVIEQTIEHKSRMFTFGK